MQLLKAVESFKDKKVLVIGDVMLDKFLFGDVNRINPEAPVPVLWARKETYSLGGAGHLANNLSAVGAQVYIVSVVGNDKANTKLKQLMNEKGMISELIMDVSRPTIQKIRHYGRGQQMLRLDLETVQPISNDIENLVLQKIKEVLPKCNLIIFSDYAKGLITQNVAQQIIQLAKEQNKLTIVDTKPHNAKFYHGCDLISLNVGEAKKLTKIKGENDTDVAEMCLLLFKQFNSAIAITRGPDGMTVCEKNGQISHISQRKVEVCDVSGAGDTVTSILGLSLSIGLSLSEAAKIANHAGGIAVSKQGIVPVTCNEIKSTLRHDIHEYLKESIKVKQNVIENQMDKVEQITNMIIDTYKNNKKILVFGNGGSAGDAQHLAAELVGRYKKERKGLSAIALTTDSSILTAIANDYGYDYVFSRQVEANCQPGDLVIGITTSGNSPNVLLAFDKAKDIGAQTICFTGKNGGKSVERSDICIVVPSDNTPRIQETHIALIHIICEILENTLFQDE
ncbi:MAG: D-sedoheptulose 7-phosphate isomerase [archaeon]